MFGEITKHINILYFVLTQISVFFIFILFIKKVIFAWFDPLIVYYFFHSFATTLVLILFFKYHVIKPLYFYTFIISNIAFIVGLRFYKTPIINTLENSFDDNGFRLVNIYLWLCVILLLLANGFLFYSKGTVPILSDNPNQAKILLYQGGFGFVRRMNFSLIVIGFSIVFQLLFSPFYQVSYIQRIWLIIAFFLLLIIMASTGSKSALLQILSIIFPIFFLNKLINNNKSSIQNPERFIKITSKHLSSIASYSKYLLALAFIYMILIFSKLSTSTNADFLEPIQERFIGAGDVYFFYYVFDLDKSFSSNNILTFFTAAFSSVLGILRLSNYDYALGSYIMAKAYNSKVDSFGPNPQHPIEGLVYFGKYFAWVYSLILGIFVSYIRLSYVKKIFTNPSQLNILFYTCISSILLSIPIDISFFFSQIFDLIIWGGGPLLLAIILNYQYTATNQQYKS